MTGFTYQISRDNFSEQQNIIQDRLTAFNNAVTGLQMDHLGVFCYKDQQLVGGLIGYMIVQSLNIKLLWVDEAYRGQGIGKELIKRTESYAKENNLNTLFVDTLSFQAPKFYKENDYKEIFCIKNYFSDFDRIFYKKELS